jgi:hypothetical protein
MEVGQGAVGAVTPKKKDNIKWHEVCRFIMLQAVHATFLGPHIFLNTFKDTFNLRFSFRARSDVSELGTNILMLRVCEMKEVR